MSRVLIVDDSEIDRMALQLLLKRHIPGLQAVECANLNSAMSRIEQGQYDVLVLDVMLGADPIEPLIERARQLGLPLVLMTSAPSLAPRGYPVIVKDMYMMQKKDVADIVHRAMTPAGC